MPRVSTREGHPVVEVRDRSLYAHDHVAGPMIERLGETRAENIYQGVAEDFWNFYAPEIAREFGYGAVWSAGRSSGWLWAEGADWDYPLDVERPIGPLDEYDTEQYERRAQFFKFAERIDAAVKDAQAEYVERLSEALAGDSRETIEQAHWAARDVVTVEAP